MSTGMQELSYPEALRLVRAHAPLMPQERVDLSRAVGRVLHAPLLAFRDEPPGDKSAMDGFALRATDTLGASPEKPLAFRYQAVVGAGHLYGGDAPKALPPGAAVRLMTGALLPPGADCVVKLEDVEETDPPGTEGGRFLLRAPLAPYTHVFPAGSTQRAGETLLAPGTVLDAHMLALIASQGEPRPLVRRQPVVGVLALGDELAPPGTSLEPGQIYMSNPYQLEALLAEEGCQPRLLGIRGDDPHAIADCLRAGMAGDAGAPPADVLLTLGGSHRGDFDFVERVLNSLGAQLHFRQTRLNVAGSTLFASMVHGERRVLFLGLPGTPSAAWCGFEAFVRPALRAMQGRVPAGLPSLWATLASAPRIRPGRAHLIPLRLDWGSADAPPAAALPLAAPLGRGDRTHGARGGAPHPDLPTPMLADALLWLEEDAPPPAEGERVRVSLLPGRPRAGTEI